MPLKLPPFLPLSNALRGVLIPNGKKCVSSMDGNLATAVRSPRGAFVMGNKRNQEVDINYFNIFFTRAHFRVLKASAQQHGIRLVADLTPRFGCLQAKVIHAATLHHTVARRERWWN